jgi:uncharacterized membrane protein
MEANVTIPPAHGVPERARRKIAVNVPVKERWFSALGGGALAAYGLRHRGVSGIMMAALGSALLARGASGRCAIYRSLGIGAGVDALRRGNARFEHAVTIARPREAVYRYLREPQRAEDLLRDVGRMRVVEEQENERIIWRSYDVGAGERSVIARVADAPGGRGTEVELILEQAAPAGKLGRSMVKLFGGGPEVNLRRALRKLKQCMEAGEIPVVEGQSSGRQAVA